MEPFQSLCVNAVWRGRHGLSGRRQRLAPLVGYQSYGPCWPVASRCRVSRPT